jgi:hypothetical protein
MSNPLTAKASWLSDITHVDVNIPAGTIHVDVPTPQQIPEQIEAAVRQAPAAIEGAARAIFNPQGEQLATAIRQAEAQAGYGAQPVPESIRHVLRGIVPAEALDGARWNTVSSSRITMADIILVKADDVAAVTVGSVIVFDDRADAESNWKLWAHELFHVMQYRNMGIEAFAHVYLLSGGQELERPAYEFADEVERRVQARDGGAPVQAFTVDRRSGGASGDDVFGMIQDEFRRQAPATSCLDIDDDGARATVTNVCSVPVHVHSFVEIDRASGRRYPGMCGGPGITCVIAPGRVYPVIVPHGGCVAEVSFSFFADGRNAEAGTYEGDCSEYVNGQDDEPAEDDGLGRSCCMFGGGRCGPFLNQPALPIGSQCMCNYGDPSSGGRVCAP